MAGNVMKCILFFFLGVRGLLRWNRARREGGKKIGKAVPILLGVVAVLLVSQMALVFPSMMGPCFVSA